jgi:hypothetical protein
MSGPQASVDVSDLSKAASNTSEISPMRPIGCRAPSASYVSLWCIGVLIMPSAGVYPNAKACIRLPSFLSPHKKEIEEIGCNNGHVLFDHLICEGAWSKDADVVCQFIDPSKVSQPIGNYAFASLRVADVSGSCQHVRAD